MKKLFLLLLLISNLVMAELTPKPEGKPLITEGYQEPMTHCGRFPYSDGCVSCTSDTILTLAKKIDGITFLIKTTETRLAKDHGFCYRYNNDSTKDIFEDKPRKKTEFMIMDLDNRMLEHKHVDDSAFAKPIKLTESSRYFPYTIISTKILGGHNVNNTHHIYRTNPSFRKIAVLKAGEPNINFL